MTDAERLLIRHGDTRHDAKKHRVYILHGERFTLHMGSRHANCRQLVAVRSRIRRLLKGVGDGVDID